MVVTTAYRHRVTLEPLRITARLIACSSGIDSAYEKRKNHRMLLLERAGHHGRHDLQRETSLV
jgi:hypothetical protein